MDGNLNKPLTKNRDPLSENEKQFLSENYLYLTDEALAEILGLSNAVTVRKIRSKMKLKRNSQNFREFLSEVPLIIWVERSLYDSESFDSFKKLSF